MAHFHEWMTAAGGLYLPAQACALCGHGVHHPRHGHRPLHRRQPVAALQRPDEFNADELARRFNVVAKHSIEKQAAAKPRRASSR